MVDLKERIDAEFENIGSVLKEIPSVKYLSELSVLELAGVATLLHNYYVMLWICILINLNR